MKKIYILLCALAAFAAASCSVKEIAEPENTPMSGNKVLREFSTIMTRTTLQSDGTTVVWEAGDSISVFDGVANNRFDISEYDATNPSASATFTGTVAEEATEFYAVYPHSAGNSLDGSTVKTSVPKVQTATAGTFDSGAAVVVAYTTSNTLAFHNVTALLGIKLSNAQTSVTSIELKGNAGEFVAGAVNATLSTSSGAVTAITPDSGSKTVTLQGTFAAGGKYYLAFIPQEFSEGITVTAHYADGTAASLSSSLEWEAVAGKSYNVVDFEKADYLEFESDTFTFDYGETKTLSWSSHNVSAITGITVPAGWSYTAFSDGSVQVTAPVKTVVLENQAGSVYQPRGEARIAYTSNGGNSKTGSAVIRLRGINSSEEFDEFRLLYGNGSASYKANGVSHAARLTACADYMIDGEITLNDNISVVSQNSSNYSYYILHHIEHNLNGNGKTITIDVNSNAWPAGFCQVIFGAVKVHDIKLAGTVDWTYSAAKTTAGCCGGFAGQSHSTNTQSVIFENVDNAININWTSASTADPTKNHAVGGFLGFWQDKPATFINCTYSGTITKNCRNLGVGGFIGWSSKSSVSKFDGCTFSGTIDDQATSSKSAWTTSTNLEIIGGFVGCTDSNASGLLEFKGCQSSGTIKFANGGRLIGGFVGKGATPVTFNDNASGAHCAFSGTIDYTEAEKSAANNGYGYIGGFLGQNSGQTGKVFNNCTASSGALIKITGGANRIGGYIGSNDKTITTFEGNSFSGTIDYTSGGFVAAGVERIGGFVGHKGGEANTNQSCTFDGAILVRKGAQNVGGLIAWEPVADVFKDCSFAGSIDFTSYDSPDNKDCCGSVGGFVSAASEPNVEVKMENCHVTSAASITTYGDITSCGGFFGNSGAGKPMTKATLSGCTFLGTLTHTATSDTGNRRIGGFVGDAARQVSLTNCSNAGTMILHENGKGFVAFGGLLGRTTATSDGYTMAFNLDGCSFSGTVTVYNSSNSAAADRYGTLIGNNTGFAVTTIDGNTESSNASVNYGTTSVTFATE